MATKKFEFSFNSQGAIPTNTEVQADAAAWNRTGEPQCLMVGLINHYIIRNDVIVMYWSHDPHMIQGECCVVVFSQCVWPEERIRSHTGSR